jgi:hypothetical protein
MQSLFSLQSLIKKMKVTVRSLFTFNCSENLMEVVKEVNDGCMLVVRCCLKEILSNKVYGR